MDKETLSSYFDSTINRLHSGHGMDKCTLGRMLTLSFVGELLYSEMKAFLNEDSFDVISKYMSSVYDKCSMSYPDYLSSPSVNGADRIHSSGYTI